MKKEKEKEKVKQSLVRFHYQNSTK